MYGMDAIKFKIDALKKCDILKQVMNDTGRKFGKK